MFSACFVAFDGAHNQLKATATTAIGSASVANFKGDIGIDRRRRLLRLGKGCSSRGSHCIRECQMPPPRPLALDSATPRLYRRPQPPPLVLPWFLGAMATAASIAGMPLTVHAGGGLAECWPDIHVGADGIRDRRPSSWFECCNPHLGPGGDPRCWGPRPIHKHHRGSRALPLNLTFARCCAHSTGDTMESVARSHAFTQDHPWKCSGPKRWACELALNRTIRARRTRQVARQLIDEREKASTTVEDIDRDAIPVLGWPVAFDPRGLTFRLLRSIDFPVKLLVLVVAGASAHLARIATEAKRLQANVRIVRTKENLGCAGGWNEVLHAAPNARWWLVASYDVAFPPGALRAIAARTEAALEREALGGRAAPGLRAFNIRGQPAHVNSLPTFVLTRRAVAVTGLFDENFWPAYAEDHDFLRRMRLVGGSRVGAGVTRDSLIEIVHGPEDWEDGVHYSGIADLALGPGPPTSSSMTSETNSLSREEHLQEEMSIVAEQLRAADNYHLHYCQKFGPLGRAGNCNDTQYDLTGPFGLVTASWNDWVLDPNRRMCSYEGSSLCVYDLRSLTHPYVVE
eukprot:TRINITY_DN33850_c0_g1_i1.p1 TRINITY_DN33850_c0_g1~~TRINITY_DN33850_c0_g1_i1.p1  ORF type:complete len:572 (-),score=68.19 TRINITY_DN33850_c0_g1_i1:109-1824(-)